MQAASCIRSIAAVTPTLASLMQIAPPAGATEPGLEEVALAARQVLDGRPVQRVLAFLPDAVGARVWGLYPDTLAAVGQYAPLRVAMRSVLPPKTPVCFASMFTGGMPEYHGIRVYQRPVLTCDTFFDALLRAGRRPAIVSVRNCSMDLIFRDRQMEYHSEPDDTAVTQRAQDLLEAGEHDFIAVYHSAVDNAQHRGAPEGPLFEQAVLGVVQGFCRLAKTFEQTARHQRRALLFAPDHGGHLDPATGKGDHGQDIPEDMDVYHCFGLASAGV